MEKVYIGEIIREQRTKLKISQEELCDGICSQVTLSRLENGAQAPSYLKTKALLERLSLSDDLYKVVSSAAELAAETLSKEVRAKVITFRKATGPDKAALRADAWEATQRLESVTTEEPWVKQRIAQDRCVLGKPEGPYSPQEQREILWETLHLTLPHFDLEHMARFRYTQEEIGLLNHIATTYALEGNSQQAIQIYQQLIDYIQSHNQQLSRYANQLTMVAQNYAIELAKAGQYEDAIEIAEIGRKICVEYDRHQFHPGLLHVMAECQHFLGHDEESEKLYTQAYYLYKAFGGGRNLDLLKKDAHAQLGLIFD